MTYGTIDFRIKEAKERAAFAELFYPQGEPPTAADDARWNLAERLAQIERGEGLRGMTKNDATIVAREYYERIIN